MAGRWDVTETDAGGHAWVLFREAGREYVLETVGHTRAEMVQPLEAVRTQYEPHFAINGRFETTAFGGYLLALKRRRAERRTRRKGGTDGRAA